MRYDRYLRRKLRGLWQKGENKLAQLMNYLLSNGLIEEAQKAAADEIARKEMYIKYGIEN